MGAINKGHILIKERVSNPTDEKTTTTISVPFTDPKKQRAESGRQFSLENFLDISSIKL